MSDSQNAFEPEFDKTTREWIVGQVGLAGLYEISRIKRLESEGLSHNKDLISVEYAAILTMLRQNGRICLIPPKTRADFDNLLHHEKQRRRSLKMEGDRAVVFESESGKRLSRYSKLFKAFPDSIPLSEYDAHVFSTLYDRVKHHAGGRLGAMVFHRFEGKTDRGHDLVAYLFLEVSGSLANKFKNAFSDPAVPKRLFVRDGHHLVEKDPMLAHSGLITAKHLKSVQSGIVLSHR
jgi:hypothetical protein